MIPISKGFVDKRYIVIKVETGWKAGQRLGNLKIYPGQEIKIVQKIHDICRVSVGMATYVLGAGICNKIMVEAIK